MQGDSHYVRSGGFGDGGLTANAYLANCMRLKDDRRKVADSCSEMPVSDLLKTYRWSRHVGMHRLWERPSRGNSSWHATYVCESSSTQSPSAQ